MTVGVQLLASNDRLGQILGGYFHNLNKVIAPHFYTSEVGVTNLTVCLPMTLARAWLMQRTHTFNVGHRSLGKVSPV